SRISVNYHWGRIEEVVQGERFNWSRSEILTKFDPDDLRQFFRAGLNGRTLPLEPSAFSIKSSPGHALPPVVNWISLASRNLLRNVRRSITTIAAVALG